MMVNVERVWAGKHDSVSFGRDPLGSDLKDDNNLAIGLRAGQRVPDLLFEMAIRVLRHIQYAPIMSLSIKSAAI